MSAADREAFEAVAGDLLRDLGYDLPILIGPDGFRLLAPDAAQPPPARPLRAPVPRPVRGRGRALGHDPAAADARLAPGARDPAGDALPQPADPVVGAAAVQPADRRRRTIVHDERRRWNDFGLDEEDLLGQLRGRSSPSTPPTRCAAFYELYADQARQAPLGRQDAGLHPQDEEAAEDAARGALHPRDPRRPRRRPVAERADHQARQGPGAAARDGAPLAQADRQGAGRRATSSSTTSRSATRTWSPTPRGSCAASASTSSSTSTR